MDISEGHDARDSDVLLPTPAAGGIGALEVRPRPLYARGVEKNHQISKTGDIRIHGATGQDEVCAYA